MAPKIVHLAVIFLLFIPHAIAAPENEYKITYTINVKEDGTAFWNVEYRTLLVTKGDFNSFENYTQQLKPVYLNEFKDLMQKSVSGAAAATSRSMTAAGFTGDATVQSAPTGTYGVVHYSFLWTNFARADSNLNIGDAFIGGLYLSKDNTLVIQYPSGYAVEQVAPQPDLVRDGMIWYGMRTFGAGEPRIVLSKPAFPWVPAGIIIFAIAAGAFIYMRKIRGKNANEKETAESISETEMMDLEERIVKLLKESGGSVYQSEIVRRFNLPKSTVSSALNELHDRKLIDKIKKGRENLIRLK